MEVLAAATAAVAVLGFAGCYAPAVRDCTVSCDSPGDCAGGQVCGSDGMCAAPGVAGHCARVAPDAGPDAPPRDAGATPDAPPDAMPTVRLGVQVMGRGSIVLDGVTVCSSDDPQHGNCVYAVLPGVAITAQATPIQLDQVFTMWTSTVCQDQGSRCTFTPDAATTISARFVKNGSHAGP